MGTQYSRSRFASLLHHVQKSSSICGLVTNAFVLEGNRRWPRPIRQNEVDAAESACALQCITLELRLVQDHTAWSHAVHETESDTVRSYPEVSPALHHFLVGDPGDRFADDLPVFDPYSKRLPPCSRLVRIHPVIAQPIANVTLRF